MAFAQSGTETRNAMQAFVSVGERKFNFAEVSILAFLSMADFHIDRARNSWVRMAGGGEANVQRWNRYLARLIADSVVVVRSDGSGRVTLSNLIGALAFHYAPEEK